MNGNDFDAILEQVGIVLQELGIENAIVGSVASSRFGMQRATMDVDIVIDLHGTKIAPLVAALRADFYLDEELMLEALERRSSFNALHLETGLKLDFFALKPRAYDRVALSRRSDGLPSFMTAEDVLLGKLEWFRAGDEISDRQWNDILGILRTQPSLDFAYLEHWAREIGVEDLLERARTEGRDSA